MNKIYSVFADNYKYLLSIVITIVLAIILYTDSLHYPIKFLAIIFIFSSLLILFLPKKIELAAFFTILIFGSISVFITPINDVPDEFVHYARSVYVAEGDFNLSNKSQNLKVSKDVKIISKNTGTTYQNKILRNIKHKKQEYSEILIKGTNAYYSFSYFPQALGIVIGNLLSFSILTTYYFGRFTNLIIYSLLILLAIKISDRYKQVIAVVAMLPMNIYLAASYNQDGFAIGLILLTVALFIKLLTSEDKPKNRLILVIMMLLSSLLVLTKFTYFLLILLPIFVPNKKFGKSEKFISATKFLILLGVILFAAFWFKTYGQIKTPYKADFLQKVDGAKQIHNIITTPLLYGRVIIREMIVKTVNMDNIFQFGPLTYGNTNIFSLYMIFLIFVYLSNANKILVSFKEKLGISLVVLGIIGATVLAMYLTWTPAGELVVLGVQNRYLIGIIPLILLLFSIKSTKLKHLEDLISNKLATNISILFIIVMLLTTVFKYY